MKECSLLSVRQPESELNKDGFKMMVVRCEHESSEWPGFKYLKVGLEVSQRQEALGATTGIKFAHICTPQYLPLGAL